MSGVRLSTCPKFPTRKMSRESKIFLQERISVRRCEQSEVINVTKMSGQGPSLLRMVERMIDVTKISDKGGEFWQGTEKQFLDGTRQPISRISASTRELKRIVSLLESAEDKMYSAMLRAGG